MRNWEPRWEPFVFKNHGNLTLLISPKKSAGTAGNRFWAFCRGETAVPGNGLSWVINITTITVIFEEPLLGALRGGPAEAPRT